MTWDVKEGLSSGVIKSPIYGERRWARLVSVLDEPIKDFTGAGQSQSTTAA